MRRYFGIVITTLLVIAVLIAMSAAGNVEFDHPSETESSPNRSSYNAGPTGTRAFYQLLEESGIPVARWRAEYESLNDKAKDATLIIVGPYQFGGRISEQETLQLRLWVINGGRLLIVSRFPRNQFGDSAIHSEYKKETPNWETPAERIELIVDDKSDDLIVQPTELTHGLRGLALSGFAARMRFYADVAETEIDQKATPTPSVAPPPKPATDEREIEGVSSPVPLSSPGASPNISPEATPDLFPERFPADENEGTDDFHEPLYAPVVHLGDKQGAVLADFQYGLGRIIILSDPFVIANNGIGRGTNLTLALNLARSLSNGGRRFLFDEFHHGYLDSSNPLLNYFRGTPMPWLVAQGVLLAAMLIYTYGRRFARALPLPQTDRHSPLEFVGSMANLQQAAEARDLALENIYPRFKTKLCRRLGISSRALTDEIVEAAERQRLPISANELRLMLRTSEAVLKGGKAVERFDDGQLIKTVTVMRRITAHLNR